MLNFGELNIMSSLFIILCGGWRFISYRKHFLNSLLRLEFIMLGVFWLLRISLVRVGIEIYFSLIFLTLVACEGALGLSLLVLVVRRHGNDQYSRLSLLEC